MIGVGVAVLRVGTVVVGSLGDARQLAVVEPVEQAGFATVDDDVAGAGVGVGLHGAMAFGTIDAAVEIAGVHGRLNDAASLCGPQRVDESLKLLHGDQHAAALGAVEKREFGEGGLHERKVAADGAGLVGSLLEYADAVVIGVGDDDVVAEVADKSIAMGVHGSAAGGTVH